MSIITIVSGKSNLINLSHEKGNPSYNRSLVYNYFNLYKSSSKLILYHTQVVGLILPNYFGDKAICIDWYHLQFFEDDILKRIIEEIIDYCGSKDIIIRNLSANLFKKLGKVLKVLDIDFQNYNSKPYYPSENTYPHVVYRLDQDKLILQKYLYFGTNNCFSVPIFSESNFATYRNTAYRVSRRFAGVSLVPEDFNFYRSIIRTWKKNITNSHKGNLIQIDKFSYDLSLFKSFWLKPLMDFPAFYHRYSSVFKFVWRAFEYKENKGIWIGVIDSNSLFVIIFLNDRNDPIFSDLLFLDIISIAYREGLDGIFMGGSESKSLYQFKRKFYSSFEGSFQQKFIDLIIPYTFKND